MEDTQIVDLFWDRKETAIKAVGEKYNDFCFKIAWNLLSDREDSEECVNDTWYAAWRAIPPKRPTRLAVFLGKITRGFAIDRLRKRYAKKRTDMHIADICGEVEKLNSCVYDNLDERMSAEELVHIINGFLGSLSDKDRDIFIQRYWCMIPLKEIADRYHVSEGSVKQNLLRSRRKLQKILESEGRFL